MAKFAPILKAATKNAGGNAALEKRLPKPNTVRRIKGVADDRYLSQMLLRVFSAGLSHKMVANKWPEFEKVFFGFAPRRVRAMNDEALEALMGDRRIIRHWGKIKSVRANAAAMCDVVDEAGSFGAWLADWPEDDIVGLWAEMAKRFTQMGGASTPRFLRMVGKDTFILTPDVVQALNGAGVAKGKLNGKRDRALVQQAFNEWRVETGLPLCQMSLILAISVG
jgi:3-methyladenine DNA glycosylase Tag